jgi:hypothetical protein
VVVANTMATTVVAGGTVNTATPNTVVSGGTTTVTAVIKSSAVSHGVSSLAVLLPIAFGWLFLAC